MLREVPLVVLGLYLDLLLRVLRVLVDGTAGQDLQVHTEAVGERLHLDLFQVEGVTGIGRNKDTDGRQ